MLLSIAAVALPLAVRAGSEADTAADARQAYNAKVAAKYNYKFGPDKPFLPSNLTTDTGEFIDPKTFPTAQYCSHCHQETHAQWRQSAHSNSNRAPWYLRNVNLLTAQKGVAYTRHCEGCHDPLAVVAGALTDGAPTAAPPKTPRAYDQDGVTCMVCHSIQKVDTRGTGSYVLAPAAVLVDEAGKPIQRAVSDAEILAHLDRHSAAVMKPFYKTSEFCASCHKAALPHDLNDYKWLRAFSAYDEWQASSWAKESPLPFYKKDTVSGCQTCHMMREPLIGVDYGAKNGQLASHRWLGANTIVPQFYKFDQQSARIQAFLKSLTFNIDLFSLEPASAETTNTPATPIAEPIGLVPFDLTPGQRVTLTFVLQNKGIGHSLVPEQRDMYESWVDLALKDSTGKILAESGAMQPNADLDLSAHSFTNRLINKAGTLNDLHQVWNNRVVAYNNSVQAGRSQLVRYTFTVPTDSPRFTITATIRYRRFDQHFMDFAMDQKNGSHYEQPIIDMVSATRTFTIGHNNPDPKAAPADPKAKPDPLAPNPLWMRWNNDGIALLDAQQYAASVHAFEQVAKLRPDYNDIYTNLGLTYIQWEKYDEAVPFLEQALKLAPEDPRALYYLSLVLRNQGQVDQAIANLQKIILKFPRSRDAHRELGFSFYQQHKYPEARAEYEAVQGIDPDDLAAHYNLAILYRRMGLKDKAAEQSAYFADQKDDPTASTFALEYLRKHHEIAQESIPWHTHDLIQTSP